MVLNEMVLSVQSFVDDLVWSGYCEGMSWLCPASPWGLSHLLDWIGLVWVGMGRGASRWGMGILVNREELGGDWEGWGVLCGGRGSDWWEVEVMRWDDVMMMWWRHDGWESGGDGLWCSGDASVGRMRWGEHSMWGHGTWDEWEHKDWCGCVRTWW